MKSLHFGAAFAAAAAMTVLHVGYVGNYAQAEIRAVVPLTPKPQRKGVRRVRAYRALNRSRRWRAADSYKEARGMSPFPRMPVR
jgi:hypothetical protein